MRLILLRLKLRRGLAAAGWLAILAGAGAGCIRPASAVIASPSAAVQATAGSLDPTGAAAPAPAASLTPEPVDAGTRDAGARDAGTRDAGAADAGAPAAAPAETPTQAALQPKPGRWEGQPALSFQVSAEGVIENFRMAIPFGTPAPGETGECAVEGRDIPIEADGTFLIRVLAPAELNTYFGPLLQAAGIPTPAPVEAENGNGNGAEVEIQRIEGILTSPDQAVGSYQVLICEDRISPAGQSGGVWTASWVGP